MVCKTHYRESILPAIFGNQADVPKVSGNLVTYAAATVSAGF